LNRPPCHPPPTSAEERTQILDTIRRFVDREVIPVASRYEHDDEYPAPLVARMQELGLFGATIAPEYGGSGSTTAPTRWSSKRSAAAG
jgi:alkylation response protein AidB-like acyl-CoA dehydrogenase